MKSVDEHLKRILAAVAPLEPLELPLEDAHGCVLADDVVAAFPVPPFDNSAMDGYAVRVDDVAPATDADPVTLPVVADLAAGANPQEVSVQPGFCVRIMTGAPVPRGAEAIVPVEVTDAGVAKVRVRAPATPGQHIRRAGDDVAAGSVVLAKGTRLGAAHIGLLAAVGRGRARCYPRPRVVVLSTGDELVEPGEPLGPGHIADANGHALAAAVRETGAIAYRAGVVPDEPRLLLETLEDHLIRADVVITSGGVSVGARDVVKEVLSGLGTVTFDRVAMQPGMPQGFGTIGYEKTPIFTLPGNPVSALVSFEVFVRPALRRMLGAEPLFRPTATAVITAPMSSPKGKRQYVRARFERAVGREARVTPIGGSGSHLLASLAAANALVVVPEAVTDVPAGALVTVMLLERRGR